MTQREPITQHLIDSIVYLSITDNDFAGAVRAALPAELFSSSLVERILTLCQSYYDQHREAPQEHFQDEFARLLRSVPEEDHKLFVDYADRVQKMRPPNRKYVMSRVNNFIRSRALEDTAIEVARLTERGEYDQAESRMYEALHAGLRLENIGLDFLRDKFPMKRRLSYSEPLVGTGWKTLDRQIDGGLHRGRFLVILGKYKGKKTWALCNIGQRAVLKGLVVVHLTHEMSEGEIEQRYDQMFGSLVCSRGAEEVNIPYYDDEAHEIKMNRIKCSSVFDRAAVLEARRNVRRFGGRLLIKKYPMGTCSMQEVDRYLNYLECFEGIIPDVLLNDYADIMAPVDPRKQLRDQINETYIWHKRIADERNILVVTASQATRQAIEKERFSIKDFAEDIRKIGNCDLAIGVCQSPTQAEQGICRAVLLASRNTKDVGIETSFGSALEIGRLVAWEKVKLRLKNGEEKKEDRKQDNLTTQEEEVKNGQAYLNER